LTNSLKEKESAVAKTRLNLNGQVAVVTGGSRGIGRAVVLRLAELGASVVVNYVKDANAAESIVAQCRELGVKAAAIRADVAQLSDAQALIDKTMAQFNRLDILVCSAGIWEGAPVEVIPEELWDRTIEVNLKGTWTVCRSAVPVMKKQRSGRIVIISSTAGQRGEANVSNYAASKGGQISFTKSLSSELAEFGVTVNCVAPGWVDTELNDNVFADKERLNSIVRGIPLGRVATADDIAYPVVFLCTEWARHITGEVLNVNGGSVLCG
jgi:3-oxoacyl-[acyl-carrier protein] reductase